MNARSRRRFARAMRVEIRGRWLEIKRPEDEASLTGCLTADADDLAAWLEREAAHRGGPSLYRSCAKGGAAAIRRWIAERAAGR